MAAELLPHRSDAVAIVDVSSGTSLTHRQLRDAIDVRSRANANLAGRLAFLGVEPRLDAVIELLSLVEVGATVALLDPMTSTETMAHWTDAYRPDSISGFRHSPDRRDSTTAGPPMAESVLLPTSGSTGNPKFVRLSSQALAANAHQIVNATFITENDRALVHLPLYFSYGLSVLTSHLAAGASVVLSTTSATRPAFSAELAQHHVTCLPGVPFSLELYRRTRLISRELPRLRSLTTSGGRVPDTIRDELLPELIERGIEFWAMYGQTEASGRIAVLPPQEALANFGSVGYAVAESRVSLKNIDAEGIGDVHVRGPGNMLGYALRREDLDTGSSPLADLDTGDLGRFDSAGRLWLTGRRQRIAKLYGARVALDDVESQLSTYGVLAAAAQGDRIVVVVAADSTVTTREMERAMGFPPHSITVARVDEVPRTASGKVDYARLSAALEGLTS